MKDTKVIVILASLLLPVICDAVTGSQDMAIQASTLLPVSGAQIENGTILIRELILIADPSGALLIDSRSLARGESVHPRQAKVRSRAG
jgi:hypothetical protein